MRRVRTAKQTGIQRITLVGGTWVPVAAGDDPETPVADGLYCLDHKTWHPLADYYPDRVKATGRSSTCKAAQKARFKPRSVLIRRKNKYD